MLSKGLLLFKNDAFRGKIVNSEHGGSQTLKDHLLLKNDAFEVKQSTWNIGAQTAQTQSQIKITMLTTTGYKMLNTEQWDLNHISKVTSQNMESA